MKRNALLFTLAMLLTPVFAFYSSEQNNDRPAELLQSLVIGARNVDIHIPHHYQMVTHDISEHQHLLGFVRDTESLEKWTQYLSLNISTNTQASASGRIAELAHYLRQSYPGAKVLSSDINRYKSGYQEAHTTILYTDEIGELIVSASYYSDSASLIGVEVSQRIRRSVASSQKTAERIAKETIKLSKA